MSGIAASVGSRSAVSSFGATGKREGQKTPLPGDVIVGNRIRDRRIVLGMSQAILANGIGVTFQQVQKYERGINRIGAARLHAIAQVLGTTPGFFFAAHSEIPNKETVERLSQASDHSIAAKRIRKRRNALGLTQQALAAKAGVSVRLIQRYEQGKGKLRASRLLEVVRALGMNREFSIVDGDPATGDDAKRYAASAEGIQLNLTVASITDPAARWLVVEFAEQLRRQQLPLEALE